VKILIKNQVAKLSPHPATPKQGMGWTKTLRYENSTPTLNGTPILEN